MKPLEWSVIEEFKDVLKGKVLFSNTVLRSLQSHWYLTKKEKAQFQVKTLNRCALLEILHHKPRGFECLMNALLKEKRSNEFFVNKMKEALKKKERREKSNENKKQQQNLIPSVIEGNQIYPGLTKLIKGIPDNVKFEEENLQILTEDLEILRKTMDPEEKMSKLSLDQIHREVVKSHTNAHEDKVKSLKLRMKEQKAEIKGYEEEKRSLLRERDDLKEKIREMEKEEERARRKEALMNIESECSTNPAAANSIKVYHIKAENVNINS